MSLLEPRPRIEPAVAARIRGWARELWAVPDAGTVTVTELECSKPGCPPHETVIVVSPRAGATFQRKLHKPAADLTRDDLEAVR